MVVPSRSSVGKIYEDDFKKESDNVRRATAACPSAIHVVRLVDSFQDPDHHSCCCVATTPLAKVDVRHLLEGGWPYSLDDVVQWGLDMAEALVSLHYDAKLYHGDICPRNVLVGHDGHAYLTDFGISTRHRRYGNTPDDMPVGKYSASVAPEMLIGHGGFDLAADLWSWGVIMDALLSRSLERAGEDVDHEEVHRIFLGLQDRGDRSRYERWVEELRACWPLEEGQRVANMASIVSACLRVVEDRILSQTVVHLFRGLIAKAGCTTPNSAESTCIEKLLEDPVIETDIKLEQLRFATALPEGDDAVR